jgi:Protein of unknown function (DUF1091)
MFYKNGQRWRQILGVENIDFCGLLKEVNNNPFLKALINTYKKLFPKLPSNCPILPGNYSVKDAIAIVNEKSELNMTMKDFQDKAAVSFKDMWATMSPTILPNGLYRSFLRVYNKEDPIGFCVYWISEINYRMNEQDF